MGSAVWGLVQCSIGILSARKVGLSEKGRPQLPHQDFPRSALLSNTGMGMVWDMRLGMVLGMRPGMVLGMRPGMKDGIAAVCLFPDNVEWLLEHKAPVLQRRQKALEKEQILTSEESD